VIQAIVGKALGIDRRHVWREPAIGHGFSIGQRNHAIDGDFRANIRPVECLEQWFGQRQTRGFDQNVFGARIQRHQSLDGGNKVVRHRAADTPIGQLENVFCGAIGDGTRFQNLAIHTDIAKFIHDHRQAFALRVLHKLTDQRRFTGPQKAGDHGDG